MQSIKHLREQVEFYKEVLDKIDNSNKEYQKKIEANHMERDSIKVKYDNYVNLLGMVEEDFKQYGWNPAG